MDSPTQPQSTQLSRDALLIHGLALAFAGATVGTVVWMGREYQPAVVVDAVATFVLIVWSVVLAVRALWRGQAARWPAVVFALCSIEAAAVCSLYLFWDAVFDFFAALGLSQTVTLQSVVFVRNLGLPAFVPVFVLANLAGVCVAWWRVRRAERRERHASTRAGTPVPQVAAPWTRRRCLKRGMPWYAAVAALAVAVLLPGPLFLYCLYMNGDNLRESPGWRGWVIAHTPLVVGEATAAILSPMKGVRANELYNRALSSGRVAQARLLSDTSAKLADETRCCAIHGLFRGHREAALEFVSRLADGKVQAAGSFLLEEAGWVLGKYGSVEEIRGFLDPARSPRPPPQFLDRVMSGAFRERHRLELLPDLERICQGDSPSRGCALTILARQGPPEQLKRIWPGFIAQGDPQVRKAAIRLLREMPADPGLEILLAITDRGDQALERKILSKVGAMRSFGAADPKLLVRLIKVLLPLLEDKDLEVRRAATLIVADAANADWALRHQCFLLNEETRDRTDGSATSDTPEEHELIRKVREGAIWWLQENEKKEVNSEK